jgi:hypothetical protein
MKRPDPFVIRLGGGWLAAVLALAFAVDAWAATITWTNNSGVASQWSIDGNWSNSTPPTISDVAAIDKTTGKSLVTVDGNVLVGAVTMSGGRTNTLTVPSGASLTTTNYLQVNASSIAQFTGGTVFISNGLNLGSTSGSGYITQNDGSVTVKGGVGGGTYAFIGRNNSLSKGYYTLNSGDLTISTYLMMGSVGYGEFLQTGGTGTYAQSVAVGSSAGGYALYRQEGGWVKGTVGVGTAGATGRYEFVGGVITSSSTIVGATYSGGTYGNSNVTVGGWGTFEQSGGTNYANNVRLGYALNTGTTNAVGEYRISGGLLNDAGMLQVGSVGGTGTFAVVGGLATIKAGSYTQYPGSTLSVVISNGLAPIRVSGNAALAGNLRIALVGPKPVGTTVTVMSYASRSGTFESITYDPPGLDIPVLYESDGIKLSFTTGTMVFIK